jgi:hypothetical protein
MQAGGIRRRVQMETTVAITDEGVRRGQGESARVRARGAGGSERSEASGQTNVRFLALSMQVAWYQVPIRTAVVAGDGPLVARPKVDTNNHYPGRFIR